MKIRNKKLLTKSIAMAIFMSSTLYTMPITHAAFNNNTLPSGGSVVAGTNVNISDPANITQGSTNAVIKWDDFSVGANATVNFNGPSAGFNTLNYVDSGNLSQIYGTINATNGNIYIVNPAGVQIGNSAQINVGSLYVSNKNMSDDQLKAFQSGAKVDTPYTIQGNRSNAELMSLGNINAANKVTFDGNRIVLDVDRVKNGQTPLGADNITIKTTQTDFNNKDVVLGYTAYDDRVDTNSKKIGYEYTTDKNNSSTSLAKLILDDNTTKDITKKDGFMWVKDGEQLQAMNTNLGGNYAFRNSIDLNATADNKVTFNSVGLKSTDGKGFTGNLDGLGYEVYGLHINEDDAYTGLFAKTDGATIRNFNLISGSITSKSENAGAVVGNANNTVIENVKNTINVTGTNNVGGIIGTGTKVTLNGVVNAGAIKGNSNVGGLAGNLAGSTLEGESYNLGDIKGKDSSSYNIGGLVGSASNSIIGNETGFQMYNHLDVEGGYNVGGIVGNLDNSTVQNIYNDGTVNATGMTTEDYTFHTANKTNPNNKEDLEWSDGISKTVKDVAVANVGGIVGNSTNGTINDATNKADVQSNETTKNGDTYYIAGNVGGIVGKAMDTNMKNVTNEESNIRGAHNVGGIAGYFGNTDNIASDIKYTIENAINNGGDIMGTSARDINGDVITEIVRPLGGSREIFNVGNIGGIVGYMDGDNVYVTASGNRGTVHSKEIAEANKEKPLNSNTAANVGGIVGKIDRSSNANLNTIKGDVTNAAVSNSYNSADVLGYTGVGGIAGMMYNGSVASSYNTGYLRTTRLLADKGGIDSLNMGGIVGDTTENTNSRSVLYDVYNKGQIGDDTYTYYGRHIGGVVGRLSGTVEKAYNNGAIYNGYNVVGGIVGWLSAGNVNNVFNTGNITVINQNTANSGTSQVGGIVGAVGNAHGAVTISNAYNLGALRTFNNTDINGVKGNSIGGILGEVSDGTGGIDNPVIIKDVYTTGNIYAGNIAGIKGTAIEDTSAQIGKIFGRSIKQYGDYNKVVEVDNAYYIKPASVNGFNEIKNNTHEQSSNIIDVDYTARMNDNYNFSDSSAWRIYEGMTTPILNAFMPNSSKYLEDPNTNLGDIGITGVQYGTAYDPLMTFITANNYLNLDFSKLGITNSAGLVVKGNGLTLDNFTTANGAGGYFGGLIYADGALVLNGMGNEDIKLAGTSKLYGSSVDINSSGDLTINGLVQATANDKITNDKNSGNINLTANNINVYGTLKTARTGETVTIEGLNSTRGKNTVQGTINDPNEDLTTVESLYAYKVTSNKNGDLTIESNSYKDENDQNQYKGDVNLYYGNLGQGLIDVAGDVNLEGKNIYVDSDMVIDGDLNATADSTGEIVVDISNIGKVSLKQYTDSLYEELVANNGSLDVDNIIDIINKLETKIDLNDDQLTAFAEYLYDNYIINGNLKDEATESAISDAIIKGRMHNFLKSFSTDTGKYINFAGTDNAKITVDMWDYNKNVFNLKKYDQGGNTLSKELDSLYIKTNGNDLPNTQTGKDFVYIWVADGEQLKGIQDYANKDTNSKILSYNFALKNDINATDVIDYKSIGSNGTAFTGNFDGRGNRIIGLNVNNVNLNGNISTNNVGVFGTIGEKGIVKNLKVYSSTFKGYDNEGYDNVGAIAGTNNGTIDNVTTLGNTVEALGSGFSNNTLDSTKYVGAAGGVVGTNTGTVNNATSRDSVIAGDTSSTTILTTAGGIAGINNGLVANSQSHSAVIASGSKDNTYSLGGIVGVNTASGKDQDGNIIKGLDNVNAYGVTGSSILVDNTGGIAGLNSGTLNDAYNESIVKGSSNVGGIAGTNSGEISLIVNGASVTAEKNVNITDSGSFVGGLVGSTIGNISNGRNNGVITGVNYVGGLVGSNGSGVTLKDLTNDSSAEITGEEYVGGIAGTNSGSISTTGTNLINRGSITGNKYVGGIAGENKGTIENVNNDIVLNATGSNAEYFGGVTGINKGTITNATNRGNINASEASYVGGIAGQNNGTLSGAGNKGKVTGKDYVGGVAGLNTKGVIGNINSIIGIKNEGAVIAEAGGAGGIFGKNEANIQYAELSNSGTVTGKADTTGTLSGTGGIFGENTGNIDHSSLKNEVKGEVSGVNNVGGLIGINSGTIEGGRGDYNNQKNTYYKYQIYNNGTITATGNGSNIGGLIGYNKNGSLTAGYNTGNIVASGSKNVGGIVGTNEGTVDQVFNTIMTADKQNETIVGGNNVGAIIGDNTNGTLTNAYSTNGATYLVGSDTSSTKKYKIDDTSVWKTYKKGISSTNENGESYDVLKVFLTSVSYDPSKKPDFVYNGNEQFVNISGAIADEMLTDLSGKKFDAHNAAGLMGSNSHKDADIYTDWLYSGQIASSGTGDTFNPNNLGYDIDLATVRDEDKIKIDKAKLTITGNDLDRIYGNTTIQNGGYGITIDGWVNGEDFSGLIGLDHNSITDEALTGNTTGKVTNDVDNYTWTGNIIGSLKNYEFNTTVTGDSKVTQAELVINLDDVEHTYGTPNLNDYGINKDKISWVNGDNYNSDNFIVGNVVDEALIGKDKTQNANNEKNPNYEWTANVTTSNDTINKNYNIIVNKGQSTVNKADLVVDLNKVYHTYGDPNLKDYGISGVEGLTNGDEASKDKLDVEMTKDTALKDNNTHTNNAGDYTWTGSVSGIEGIENNYNITVNNGESVVNKAKLDIIIDNTTIEKGEHPNYNGQFGNDSGTNNFTNGDTPDTVFGSNWDWGITNPSLENETGTHGDAITIIINGNQYITSKEDIDKILPNYDVNISFGDLTVKDNGSSVPIVPIEPIKPVVPGIWSHIYQDQWDRNRDFKERKAEFNFVDGAIPLDEAVEEV